MKLVGLIFVVLGLDKEEEIKKERKAVNMMNKRESCKSDNKILRIGTLIVRGRSYVAATPAANRQVEHPPLTLEKPHYHTLACLRQAKPHIHTHQSLRDKKYNIAAKELKAIEPQMLHKMLHTF